MLRTVPQKELLSLLKSFGALREDQAAKLISIKNEFAILEPTVYPLVCRGEVRRENGYIIAKNGDINPNTITAIDIMLSLESKNIEALQVGASPFNLTFFKLKEDKLCRYDICVVDSGREPIVVAALEGIFTKYRTVIFVIKNIKQQDYLYAPCDYCFAIKEQNNYKFFKAERRINK